MGSPPHELLSANIHFRRKSSFNITIAFSDSATSHIPNCRVGDPLQELRDFVRYKRGLFSFTGAYNDAA